MEFEIVFGSYSQALGGFSAGVVVGGIMTLRYIAPKIYGPIINRLEMRADSGQ